MFIAQWTEHKSSELGIGVRFLIDIRIRGGTADTLVLGTRELCSVGSSNLPECTEAWESQV